MRKASANAVWQEGGWIIAGGGGRLEWTQADEGCCGRVSSRS